MQNEQFRHLLEQAEVRRKRDLKKLAKWSDRVAHELDRLLKSNRWRLGCWLSLKSAGSQSKEGQRFAALLSARPETVTASQSLVGSTAGSVGATAPTNVVRERDRRIGHLLTIVIPIHNAYDDLIRCLDSVARYTRKDHPVLLIDDASTDERIWPLLQEREAPHSNFRAVRNESNLGYTATINRASQLAGQGDIILLNSDTIVPPHWVEQLTACAYSRPDVATVTAVSNAAGAFSLPVKNAINLVPLGWHLEKMAALVEKLSSRIWPEVPTGNGFCMYITAAARAVIGWFDSENFPQGYGEENDFCLRASAFGFVHLIDDATYVFHKRSASFGEAKAAILQRSRAVLDRLHPEYTDLIGKWSANDLLDAFRAELAHRIEAATARGIASVLPRETRPCLLFVLHDGVGGTRFTSEDLLRQLATDYRCIMLLAGVEDWTLYESLPVGLKPVRSYAFADPWGLERTMTEDRREVLRDICADYLVALAHVRHLLATGPELLSILKEMGVAIVFSFHDFYTICPTIQLLDETETYCAGKCTPGPGDCPLPGNWFRPPLPWLKHRYVHEHQRRMSAALDTCDLCVTTSQASRSLLLEHFPRLAIDQRFVVIEHGRDLPRVQLATPPREAQPVRLVFFGSFNRAKGVNFVRQLLIRNEADGRPFEFHILGQKSRDFDPEELGGKYHGPYLRTELAERIRAISPSFSLVPSLWPETYCHVLTESWAMGIPVFASDIGTLRERISAHGGGWLLPVGDPDAWFTGMQKVASDREGYAIAIEQIRAMEIPNVAFMARQYAALYERLLPHRTSFAIEPEIAQKQIQVDLEERRSND